MNVFKLAATLLPVSLLGSCVYLPDMVPDMPYSGSLKTESPAPQQKRQSPNNTWFGQKSPLQQVQQQPTPKTPNMPPAAPQPTIPPASAVPVNAATAPATAVPGAVVQPTPQVIQAPQPDIQPAASPASTTITSRSSKVQPVIAPQPKEVTPKPTVVKPASTTPKPVSSAQPTPKVSATAPKAATPSPAPVSKPEVKAADAPPVASKVPGDPFRVYNPYEPSKTILIKGADGQPFPSGKKLKIQGTDKYFIVP